jgi:hypothetical protein
MRGQLSWRWLGEEMEGCTPTARGVTAPSPVTTTRRILLESGNGGGGCGGGGDVASGH